MFHSKVDEKITTRTKIPQKGSALVIAIFILVVIAGLAAALANILASSHESVAYEVQGTRAYAAAQIGVQWQLAQLFPLAAPGAKAQANACSVINISNKPVIANIEGLKGCSIEIRNACTDFEHDNGSGNVRYYKVESTGECQLDGEITSRTVEVEAHSL